MNIFEIINNKKYDNLAVIDDGEKTYTLGWIKSQLAPEINRLKADKCKNVLIAAKDNFDFALCFLAAAFSGKEIFLLADLNKTFLIEEEYISLEKIQKQSDLQSADIEFKKPDYDKTYITFFTSGSTGIPKKARKNLRNMTVESKDLLDEINSISPLENKRIKLITSTKAAHMYCFVFWLIIALCECDSFLLCADEIIYPDTSDIHDTIFVSTPSFLEKYEKYGVKLNKPPKVIFSAGDKLKTSTAEYFKKFGVLITEIYGSTETGTVAIKTGDENYRCFGSAEIQTDENSQITVKSPYFLADKISLNDTIEKLDDKTFILGARTDKIVKIQEKRVNTQEIETFLNNTDLIEASYCFKHGEKLACAAVLTPKGKEIYLDTHSQGRQSLVKRLKNLLKNKSEIVPQKWKFLYEIPKTNTGKIDKSKIEKLFNMNLSIPLVTNYSIGTTEAEYEMIFSRSCNFFEGHFTNFPVLPGVVQLYFAHMFASESFNKKILTSPSKKIKFSHVIRPDEKLKLKLCLHGKNLNYTYEYNGIIYSSGIFETAEN